VEVSKILGEHWKYVVNEWRGASWVLVVVVVLVVIMLLMNDVGRAMEESQKEPWVKQALIMSQNYKIALAQYHQANASQVPQALAFS